MWEYLYLNQAAMSLINKLDIFHRKINTNFFVTHWHPLHSTPIIDVGTQHKEFDYRRCSYLYEAKI